MVQSVLTKSFTDALDSDKRVLLCDDDIVRSYKKIFKYIRDDERLVAYSRDNVAMYSDCYILYAIAYMGVATKDGIELFLKALSSKYPELAIVFSKTKDGMEGRLRNLVDLGFAFRYRYVIDAVGDTGEKKPQTVSLYTVIDSSVHIVRQRLQKVNLRINAAIHYKPIDELIGWAAATYAGSCIAQSPYFVGYLESVLNTKQVGSAYLPFELKTSVDGTLYYIAVISSFLYHNKLIHTPNDYMDFCADKLNVIKNYLAVRTNKGVAIVCITVRDYADLEEISGLICKIPALRGYLGCIYFTGEGIIREFGGDVSKAFLQIVADAESEKGYRYERVVPDFM